PRSASGRRSATSWRRAGSGRRKPATSGRPRRPAGPRRGRRRRCRSSRGTGGCRPGSAGGPPRRPRAAAARRGAAGARRASRAADAGGVVARGLWAGEGVNTPLPKGVVPPGGRWWETTAPHLVAWSAYLDRAAHDPVEAEEARTLLARAAQASPLNATVRHAVAHTLPGESPSPAQKLALGLGQSRDVLTLAW